MELERDVESYLVRRVEDVGGLCVKAGADGWPDRIVVMPGGVTIWCEVKRRRGKLASLQTYRHEMLARTGADVRVLWSRADVDEMMAGIMRGSESV